MSYFLIDADLKQCTAKLPQTTQNSNKVKSYILITEFWHKVQYLSTKEQRNMIVDKESKRMKAQCKGEGLPEEGWGRRCLAISTSISTKVYML